MAKQRKRKKREPSKPRLINFKTTYTEKMVLRRKAKKYTEGSISALIRLALIYPERFRKIVKAGVSRR